MYCNIFSISLMCDKIKVPAARCRGLYADRQGSTGDTTTAADAGSHFSAESSGASGSGTHPNSRVVAPLQRKGFCAKLGPWRTSRASDEHHEAAAKRVTRGEDDAAGEDFGHRIYRSPCCRKSAREGSFSKTNVFTWSQVSPARHCVAVWVIHGSYKES